MEGVELIIADGVTIKDSLSADDFEQNFRIAHGTFRFWLLIPIDIPKWMLNAGSVDHMEFALCDMWKDVSKFPYDGPKHSSTVYWNRNIIGDLYLPFNLKYLSNMTQTQTPGAMGLFYTYFPIPFEDKKLRRPFDVRDPRIRSDAVVPSGDLCGQYTFRNSWGTLTGLSPVFVIRRDVFLSAVAKP